MHMLTRDRRQLLDCIAQSFYKIYNSDNNADNQCKNSRKLELKIESNGRVKATAEYTCNVDLIHISSEMCVRIENLFSNIYDDECRNERLLRLAYCMLIAHEFAHLYNGSCQYKFINPDMPINDIHCLEVQAESFAASRLADFTISLIKKDERNEVVFLQDAAMAIIGISLICLKSSNSLPYNNTHPPATIRSIYAFTNFERYSHFAHNRKICFNSIILNNPSIEKKMIELNGGADLGFAEAISCPQITEFYNNLEHNYTTNIKCELKQYTRMPLQSID